jgi:hypothetical protein
MMQMLARYARLPFALSLLVALVGVNLARRPGLRPLSRSPGAVRILSFFASRGVLAPGESARLCYAVEFARTVRISPIESVGADQHRCLDVAPEYTTHYTLLAEGFDGAVATQSFTLSVQRVPVAPRSSGQYALRPSTTTRAHSRSNS